ncbi:hypothetical protein [Mucilaginibacter paludis]|uniref:Uncharacterized protein n=1 Tax=Mucilaginibacter paludis DSM 18603 TaxID=714943 RepID=H1Y3J6_9SPHI|nr:hypothetical protein [Mucilaginibacter paludis]EHQ29764.1 hypothetical protein Mucpa_5695 [Mucilaginibacter paludis DSM 18603]
MDFRQRLEQSKIHRISVNSSAEQEENIASPYFMTDRSKNPVCLELRLSDGSRKALPYTYFTEINFEVDMGIEVVTTQKRIRITGRNLMALYECLVTYRVRYVQADMGNDAQEDGLFVSGIGLEDL